MKESSKNSIGPNVRSPSLSRADRHAEHIEAIETLERRLKEEVRRGLALLDQCVNNIAQAKWIFITVDSSVEQFRKECPVCVNDDSLASLKQKKASSSHSVDSKMPKVDASKKDKASEEKKVPLAKIVTSNSSLGVLKNPSTPEVGSSQNTQLSSKNGAVQEKPKVGPSAAATLKINRKPGPKSKTTKYDVLEKILKKAASVQVGLKDISDLLQSKTSVKYSIIKEKLVKPSRVSTSTAESLKKSSSFVFNKPAPKPSDKPKLASSREGGNSQKRSVTPEPEHKIKPSKKDLTQSAIKIEKKTHSSSHSKPQKKAGVGLVRKIYTSSDSDSSEEDTWKKLKKPSPKPRTPSKVEKKYKSVEILPSDSSSSDSDCEVLQKRKKIKVSRNTFSAIKYAVKKEKENEDESGGKDMEVPSTKENQKVKPKEIESKEKDISKAMGEKSALKSVSSHTSSKSDPFDKFKIKVGPEPTTAEKRTERKISVSSNISKSGSHFSAKAESHVSCHSVKSHSSKSSEESTATLALGASRERKTINEKRKSDKQKSRDMPTKKNDDGEKLMDIDSPPASPSSVETVHREEIKVKSPAVPREEISVNSSATVHTEQKPVNSPSSSGVTDSTEPNQSTAKPSVAPPTRQIGPKLALLMKAKLAAEAAKKRPNISEADPAFAAEVKRRKITSCDSPEFKALIKEKFMEFKAKKLAERAKNQEESKTAGVAITKVAENPERQNGNEELIEKVTQKSNCATSEGRVTNNDGKVHKDTCSSAQPELAEEDSIELGQDVIGNCLDFINTTAGETDEISGAANTITTATGPITFSDKASTSGGDDSNQAATTTENSDNFQSTLPHTPILTLQDTVSPTAMRKFFRNNSDD